MALRTSPTGSSLSAGDSRGSQAIPASPAPARLTTAPLIASPAMAQVTTGTNSPSTPAPGTMTSQVIFDPSNALAEINKVSHISSLDQKVAYGGANAYIELGVSKVQTSPALDGQLSGVSAVSGSDAWAVGTQTKRTNRKMLIERWHGKTWQVQKSPSPGGSGAFPDLFGVATVSANDAWAVGSYTQIGMSAGLTFVERWNGHAWKIQRSPNPGGASGSELNAVAATSGTNAWAVGDTDFTTGADKTLIERWNGHAWKVQPSPNPGSKSNALDGVAATSTKNAWAVGDYHNATTKPPSRNLALRWNGTSWRG